VDAYALVSAWAPEEVVDVFLRREDAEAALQAALWDEPEWATILSVEPVELVGETSLN
jgi:hypothetical protein